MSTLGRCYDGAIQYLDSCIADAEAKKTKPMHRRCGRVLRLSLEELKREVEDGRRRSDPPTDTPE